MNWQNGGMADENVMFSLFNNTILTKKLYYTTHTFNVKKSYFKDSLRVCGMTSEV